MEERELRCPFCGGHVNLARGKVVVRNPVSDPVPWERGDDDVYQCAACGKRASRRHIRLEPFTPSTIVSRPRRG